MCRGRVVCWCLPLLIVLVVPFQAAHSDETPPQPQRRALLIGVNNYAHINRLFYCGSDIVDLQKRLIAAGFPAGQVTVLSDAAEDPKDQPLRANIERELDALLRSAAPGDLVLVAFSGHGVHLGGSSYLCPLEARIDDPRQTMIAVDDVYARLRRCPAAQRLLLVDACRNDPRPGGEKSPDRPTDAVAGFSRALEKPPEGTLLLASCMPGQVSVEDEQVRHGVFMHFVLRGLEGEADRDGGDSSGTISLLELFQYASAKTRAHVAASRSLVQTPMLRGEMEGDFDLAVAPQRLPRAEMLPSVLRRGEGYVLGAMIQRSLTAADPESLRALQTACDLVLSTPTAAYRGIPRSHCARAIAACNDVIRREPENAFAYYFRGLAYQIQGEYAKALADFRQIGLPMVVSIRHDLESVDLMTGDKLTGKAYRGDDLSVTELAPGRMWVDSVRGAEGIQGWIDQKNIAIGLLYGKTGVRSAMTSLFYGDDETLLVADQPETRSALERAREILAAQEHAMYDEKSPAEYDRALAACEEALRLEPENESACFLRGVAYCWKRDYARAVSDFQKLGLPLPLNVPYGARGEGIALQMAKQETGRLEPGDRLNITAANGEWLWVDSLEFSSSSSPIRQAQGWVHQRSVEPE